MVARLTEIYGEFAGGDVSHALRPAALDVVRLGFTDCAGVILAGLREDVVQRLTGYVRGKGGHGEARLLFGEPRANAAQAALVNATAAHALDYDDYAFTNHPSAVLAPTVMAAAALVGASGQRMAAGYIVGYEVWADLMRREPDHLHSKGWHPTAVFGPVAAAAAASTVMGLDARRATHAVALAASFAGGVMENFGTMMKPYHGGRAAESGVTAAALAGVGLAASATAIEGERGLLRALSPNGRVDLETPPPFGRSWRIETLRLNIKKYPTVGASQRSIDSVLTYTKANPLDPNRIVRVTPCVSAKHAAVMPFHRPRTALEAKFSLEFAVASALRYGAVGLAQLADPVVGDPDLQALIAKVHVRAGETYDPDYPGAAPTDHVEITLDDGRTVTTPAIRRARGHADHPLSGSELRAKFDDCAAHGGIAPPASGPLYDAMQRIDALDNADGVPVLTA